MNFYDEAKIGKLIAWSGDHFVYEYGIGEVIKFSKFDLLLGFEKAKQKYASDYRVCKEYLGKYVLDTEVCISPGGKRVAKIQPKITGRFLYKSDLQDYKIQSQFKELIAGYDAMAAAGYPWLDLIGQHGVWRGCLSNIFVTPEYRLILFDATLFDVKEYPFWQRPFLYYLFLFGRVLQARVLRAFRSESDLLLLG